MPERTRIFVSYRRGRDDGFVVSRLASELERAFGPDNVFQDVSGIQPGADFAQVLDSALDRCAAAVVVIGPDWLTARDKHGNRRLDNAEDWVRHEVSRCLSHASVRVFPILIRDAEMPSAEDLPEDLRPLIRRQACALSARYWDNDVQKLIEILRRALAQAAEAPAEAAAAISLKPRDNLVPPVASVAASRRTVPALFAGALLALAIAIGAVWLYHGGEQNARALSSSSTHDGSNSSQVPSDTAAMNPQKSAAQRVASAEPAPTIPPTSNLSEPSSPSSTQVPSASPREVGAIEAVGSATAPSNSTDPSPATARTESPQLGPLPPDFGVDIRWRNSPWQDVASAAAAGDAWAQAELALRYVKGRGVRRSKADALDWARKAVAGNDLTRLALQPHFTLAELGCKVVKESLICGSM